MRHGKPCEKNSASAYVTSIAFPPNSIVFNEDCSKDQVYGSVIVRKIEWSKRGNLTRLLQLQVPHEDRWGRPLKMPRCQAFELGRSKLRRCRGQRIPSHPCFASLQPAGQSLHTWAGMSVASVELPLHAGSWRRQSQRHKAVSCECCLDPPGATFQGGQ